MLYRRFSLVIYLMYSSIYIWASLVAQTVKNLPAMWKTWVQSLGWKDTLGQGITIHSSILAWRIPMDRGARWAIVHGVTKSQTQLSNEAQYTDLSYLFFQGASVF